MGSGRPGSSRGILAGAKALSEEKVAEPLPTPKAEQMTALANMPEILLTFVVVSEKVERGGHIAVVRG